MTRRKQYWKQGIAMLLMTVILLAAIGYGNGLFDLSFATRTPSAPSGGDIPAPGPEWSLPEADGSAEAPVTSASQLAALPSLYHGLAIGRVPTAEAYSSRTPFYLSGLGYGLTLPFSKQMTTVATEVRVPIGTDAAYRSELVYTSVEKPLLELYMGYLLFENGADRFLYGGMGELLLTDFPFEPAYARDGEGRPLFVLEGQYFYYDTDTGRMLKGCLDETTLPLASGVPYATPTETPYVRFCADGK